MSEEKSKKNEIIENEKNDYEIGEHSLRRNQKERKLRKKRKKANRLKKFLRFVVFLLVGFLIYEFVMLPGWYLKEDAFNDYKSNAIRVLDNHIATTDMIMKSVANVKVTKFPIFMLDVGDIKRRLYKIPVVKRVYVRRYAFPARVDIIIKERIPTVVLKTDLKSQPVAFYTSDNVLITSRIYMRFPDNKRIRKILVKSPFSSKSWTKRKFAYIEKIIKEVEQNSGENVQYIDVRKPNDVYVKIPTASIRLGALDSTVFERIKRIYTILPEIDDLNGKVRYIDLSWDKVNYIKLK